MHLGREPCPKDFLRRRMKLNEGYRCQDLTHYDALTLADRFMETQPSKSAKIVVIGPRTAGTYFAPLISHHLRSRGLQQCFLDNSPAEKGVVPRRIRILPAEPLE